MMTSAQTSTTTTTINASEHVELVRKVAKRIARRLPSVVDVDDLVGAGAIGLMDAAARYDVTRCGHFAPYAEIRKLLGAPQPAQTVQMWARAGFAPPIGPAPRRGVDAQLIRA